ncbi:MAG: hypothetical protein ABSF03_17415 [Streptosporangiaceae bacterium]|jgi:hypothetical protein
MTIDNRASAKAQPLAEKGAVAGLPATAAAGAGHTTPDLAPRRAS